MQVADAEALLTVEETRLVLPRVVPAPQHLEDHLLTRAQRPQTLLQNQLEVAGLVVLTAVVLLANQHHALTIISVARPKPQPYNTASVPLMSVHQSFRR